MARRGNDRKANAQFGGIAFYMMPYKGKNGKTYWKGKSKNGALTITMFEINSEFGEYRVEVFGIGSALYNAKKGAYKYGAKKTHEKYQNQRSNVVYAQPSHHYGPGY